MNIFIIAEQTGGELKRTSMEVASRASVIAGETGGEVSALIFGKGSEKAAGSLGIFGVKRAYHYQEEFFSIKAATELVSKENASLILGSATVQGRDFLPKIAARLDTGFAQDCVDLKMLDGKVVATRPVFGGKALVDFQFSSQAVVTLRPKVFPVIEKKISCDITKIEAEESPQNIRVLEQKTSQDAGLDVADADIVVAGGRGTGGAEGFKPLFELAKTIKNSAVGASRSAVDAGFISYDHQIGQTGKVVNPNIYIACGISGAIQHLAGMRTSKHIIAINKDSEAPIFSVADLGIVGDYSAIVPLVTERLKKSSK